MNRRHEKILEIIKKNNIETQVELADMLNSMGFNVTQATVSRDITRLNIIKVASGSGKIYAQAKDELKIQDELMSVLTRSVISVETAQNILVVKTNVGLAMGVATCIDRLRFSAMLGSVAGDDTIISVFQDERHAAAARKKLISFI